MPPADGEPCGIRRRASFGRPTCHGPSTCVRGPTRFGRPGGTRGCNTWPGCEARAAGVHGSRAGRRAGEKKIFCCVTTRGLNLAVGSGLRRRPLPLTARPFGGGVLSFDLLVLAAFGLATGGLPTADLFPTLGILAIALAPAARNELPFAAAAEASSGTWPAPSSGASRS